VGEVGEAGVFSAGKVGEWCGEAGLNGGCVQEYHGERGLKGGNCGE
jgi:hypothetical protein